MKTYYCIKLKAVLSHKAFFDLKLIKEIRITANTLISHIEPQ